ncbi:MAG: hypothetical protein MUF49_23410 [Oculatellaceae cyanobacterium Prado106]|jgi:hypothetical protein|nr:hypothetical protein [Oculatellaceae cyanobacterium Prado106]
MTSSSNRNPAKIPRDAEEPGGEVGGEVFGEESAGVVMHEYKCTIYSINFSLYV